MTEITIFGFLAGLLLLALPLYVMFKFRLRIMDIVFASFVRMVVMMGVVGGILYFVLRYNTLWLNVLCMVTM